VILRFLALLPLLCRPAAAGVASLEDGEIAALRVLVSSDASAGALFAELRADADQSMGTPPSPVAVISTEHRLVGDPDKTRTLSALRDLSRARELALVYRVEGGPKRLAAAKAILLAWAALNRPTGQPIDETRLEPAIEAYDLLRGALPDKDREAISGWLRSAARAEIASMSDRKRWRDNWHSHRLKTVGLIAYAVGDPELARWALDELKRHLGKNLRPDGSTYDFKKRDALWYQTYDLEALLRLAIVFQRAGHPLYDWDPGNGASLRRSVAFLVPYADGHKTHAEWVQSRVEFDRERSANREEGHVVGQEFQPAHAAPAIDLAEYFEPELARLAAKLDGRPEARVPSLRVLLNEASRR
jgi:hypothetical protein